jgi:hypothetical protein
VKSPRERVRTGRNTASDAAQRNGKTVEYAEAVRKVRRLVSTPGPGPARLVGALGLLATTGGPCPPVGPLGYRWASWRRTLLRCMRQPPVVLRRVSSQRRCCKRRRRCACRLSFPAACERILWLCVHRAVRNNEHWVCCACAGACALWGRSRRYTGHVRSGILLCQSLRPVTAGPLAPSRVALLVVRRQ